jgi:predicted short-subunit dehydrogenase-like oxidoreductase (DUF2520 family)
MRIVIIGSGNVATILGKKMVLAGHKIVQVVSRHEQHAAFLARQLNCDYWANLLAINMDADFYMIAVTDEALISITRSLALGNKIVVHTAGSVMKNILLPVSPNFGVFYPLQTMRKEISGALNIPLLIDASSSDVLKVIADIAGAISNQVYKADDEMRRKLHLAATMINNFSNHLYVLTEDYCRQQNVDFRLLVPLIEETANRVKSFPPADLQTGPAKRHDTQTITNHLHALSGFPELKKIYELFTAGIQHKIKET